MVNLYIRRCLRSIKELEEKIWLPYVGAKISVYNLVQTGTRCFADCTQDGIFWPCGSWIDENGLIVFPRNFYTS